MRHLPTEPLAVSALPPVTGRDEYEAARELARRLRPDSAELTLDYVPCSRRTWNLAALDVEHMSDVRWLFNSFMRSNASDLCARLGLPLDDYAPVLQQAGVSLDPKSRGRAQQPATSDEPLPAPS